MEPDSAGYDAEAKEAVKSLAADLGFDRVGVTTAEPFDRAEAVAMERLRNGLMDGLPWYHEERVRRGASPSEILPGARSIIAVAMSYNTDEEPPPSGQPALRGKVARYARGLDYHGIMQRRLKQLVESLSDRLGRPVQARVYVDTGPMQDRAVAERAGIGWFGKNTNVLTSGHGSWVFLGQILTDLALEPDAPVKKTCGRCTICIDDCPTGALIAPYVLDNTTVHLILDHRAAGLHTHAPAPAGRRLGLRLRHLPGRVPREPQGAACTGARVSHRRARLCGHGPAAAAQDDGVGVHGALRRKPHTARQVRGPAAQRLRGPGQHRRRAGGAGSDRCPWTREQSCTRTRCVGAGRHRRRGRSHGAGVRS